MQGSAEGTAEMAPEQDGCACHLIWLDLFGPGSHREEGGGVAFLKVRAEMDILQKYPLPRYGLLCGWIELAPATPKMVAVR